MERPAARSGWCASRILAVTALALLGCSETAWRRPPARPAPPLFSAAPRVTVLLNRFRDRRAVRIEIDGPYDVADPAGRRVAYGERLDEGALVARDGGVWLNDEPIPASGATLRPGPGVPPIRIEGSGYPGEIRIRTRADDRLELVMDAPLERYLEGVVGAEMPSRFPAEALRAQAIAARTYAVWQLENGPRPPAGHPLDDTVYSMAYRGEEGAAPECRAAVRATAGSILAHDGRPFRAYFHSTCGGRTASAASVFGDPASPPLSGGAVDPHCPSSRFGRWSARVPRADVQAALARLGIRGELRSLEPDHAPARRASWTRITTDLATRRVRAADLRLSLGPAVLRSSWWTAWHLLPDALVVQGRGFGHGVGLCQVGAAGMAETGHSAREILAHFYPGSAAVRAYPAAGTPDARP